MFYERFGCVLAGSLLLMLGGLEVSGEPSVSLGPTVGEPGGTVLVPLNVTIDTNVVSLQFDLLFSTNYLATGDVSGGDALADQQVFSNVVTNGDLRVILVSFSNSPITNGVAVYVPFLIAGNSPYHDEILSLSNVILSSAEAEVVPTTVVTNTTLIITSLAIAALPQFTAISPPSALTNAVHLELLGSTGRVYSIEAAASLAQPQWTPIATNNPSTSALLEFYDTAYGAWSNRFYRAQVLR